VNRIINALGETFDLATAPTTVRPALGSESRHQVRIAAKQTRLSKEAHEEGLITIKR
jgi:hypothetical protein